MTRIFSKKTLVVGIIAIVSLGLLGGMAILYPWYTKMSMSTSGQKITNILKPENFTGGLTKLPEGLQTVQPTQIVTLNDGDTFNLTASIVQEEVGNKMVKRLAYNGQIPGPILKVQKGAKVTIHFTNNIDMETTLHPHGLRGDYHFDGTPVLTQDPIPVGGSFDYQLSFPDTGVFWYHPHIREDYQQGLGLYGDIIVSEQNYWNNVDQEKYLIFDDILENGDFDPKVVSHTLMGRFGDTILINDSDHFTVTVKQGVISRFFLTNVANVRTFDLSFSGAQVKQVGGDNGRIEKEAFIDSTMIAPSERSVIELLYKDAGTYPILNRGNTIGEVIVEKNDTSQADVFAQLRSNEADYQYIRDHMSELFTKKPDKSIKLDIELGKMSANGSTTLGQVDSDGNVVVMGVKMTKEKGIEHCKLMSQMPECGPLLALADEKIVTLAGKEMTEAQARQYCLLAPTTAGCDAYKVSGIPAMQMHQHPDGIEWEDGMLEINQMSSNQTLQWVIEDQDTGKKNSDINWTFKKGDLVKVRIFNDDKGMHPMQHPIHFHGQRFVVLGTDGVVNDDLQWKDTVLVPMGRTVDILVDMNNPGLWMAHCHIAEHLEAGMMFNFKVE